MFRATFKGHLNCISASANSRVFKMAWKMYVICQNFHLLVAFLIY